jgi:molybdopterin/thiamine biosynthesis adenylyltransferase
VEQVDLIVDCAPLFSERLAMNAEAVRQQKPLVECGIYELQAQIYTVIPGRSACVACLHPDEPPVWRREFPVFGAVSGMVACLGAMEAIKLLAGIGRPLQNRMLVADLRDMDFRMIDLERRTDCAICRQPAS